MGWASKAKCPSCGKKIRLELRGTRWVISSHNLRKIGEVNPECPGTGRAP